MVLNHTIVDDWIFCVIDQYLLFKKKEVHSEFEAAIKVEKI